MIDMPEYVAEDEFVCHNQKCLIPKTRGKRRILSALRKVGDHRKEDLKDTAGHGTVCSFSLSFSSYRSV